jgi:hypothetical protein
MTSDPRPTTAQTTIPTAHASRYLQQLCKHFAHKLPAECTPTDGSICFPMGKTELHANGQNLNISVQVADAADLDRLKEVVVSHLIRFAFREELTVDWR